MGNVASHGSGGSDYGTLVALTSNVLTVYSREVLYQASPIHRFNGVVVEKTELNKIPGDSIKFLVYDRLSGSATLTEGTVIPTTNITSSLKTVTVAEWGFGSAVTEFALKTNFTDTMMDIAKLLGQNLAFFQDGQVRDALYTIMNTVYGGQKASRATLDADSLFDTTTVKDGALNLAINKCPKIGADAYICYLHPHQSRNLRDDSRFVNFKDYSNPGDLATGEIGRYEDVRFVETTMIEYYDTSGNIFEDGVDTGNNLASGNPPVTDYVAAMVGDYCVARGISLAPELRDDGVKDFGRNHKLAWYGIWGVGIIQSTHAVLLETA